MKPKVFFYVLLGILVLSIVGGGAGFYFTNQILQKNGDTFTQKQLELSNTSTELAYLQRLEHDTIELEANLGSLTSVYPKDKQQSQVIDQLLKLAANRNIELNENKITFPPTEGLPSETSQLSEAAVPGLYGMNVDVQFVGSFDDTLDFMKDIENFRRIMNISYIRMSPKPSSNEVETALQLQVLVQQAAAPTAPASGGAGNGSAAPNNNSSGGGSAPSQGAAQ